MTQYFMAQLSYEFQNIMDKETVKMDIYTCVSSFTVAQVTVDKHHASAVRYPEFDQ